MRDLSGETVRLRRSAAEKVPFTEADRMIVLAEGEKHRRTPRPNLQERSRPWEAIAPL